MEKENIIIDNLIKCALELEKLNSRAEATEKYKEALAMFNKMDVDTRTFELQIKLGESQRMLGDMRGSINYYKDSLNTAILLENKMFEVDALNKLAEIYYLIGEIDTGITYAERIDTLLKNINYVEGELEVSLYWIKVFYSKNEYYKAREIGNKAIKLCGEKHLLYKGRILNALASGFSKVASNEEHLDFLEKALECFEKINSFKGVLSILNNIGTVYTNKIQDYSKGLDYYFKMKELCEQNDYSEATLYANINIGSTLLKCLKYENAYTVFKESVKIAEELDIINLKTFLYIYLIEVNLKLCNYKEAFYYYKKAEDEFERHPNQGDAEIYYYKAVANLMLEVGQLDKAKEYIKKAVDLVINDGTMIKWSVGYLYELIRIRESTSRSDITDAVDGIRFILTKYINDEEILNMVYDAAIEVIEAGPFEIAAAFVDKFKHLKCTQEIVELKQKYVTTVLLKEEKGKKIELLNAALELAVKAGNRKYQRKIYNSIWEVKYLEEDYAKAIDYYNKAYEIGENMALSIPEEFRSKFLY
jgi:tetratricopeptide (TPR) repeat protein